MSEQTKWQLCFVKVLLIGMIGILIMGAVILIACQDTYTIDDNHEYHNKINIELNGKIDKTINSHTEIIVSLGELHSVLLDTNDLIMRMSHYTDQHNPSQKVLLCPECTKNDISITTEPIEEEQQIYALKIDRFKQLTMDINEIKISIDAIESNLINQKMALELHLNKLREQVHESK